MLNAVMTTGVRFNDAELLKLLTRTLFFLSNKELFYSVIAKQNFSTMYENRDPARGRFIN